MFLTMVILAVFLVLYTYTCSAPSSWLEGHLWESNTFSLAQNLPFQPRRRWTIIDARCWNNTTYTTTTSNNHLQPREQVRTKLLSTTIVIKPTASDANVPSALKKERVINLISNKGKANNFMAKLQSHNFPVFPPPDANPTCTGARKITAATKTKLEAKEIASKMLGTFWSPAGNCITHVEYTVQKGLNWMDCLRTEPLPCCNAWLSFQLQLFLAILWGLVTVCPPPSKLDTMYQRLYEKALLLLGVNRKIKKEWRTLPEMYQGLALPNFPLIALAEKISFILANWGFQGVAHSDVMAMMYENFIIEVGLYDNPFMWSYADYGKLFLDATWFQNLWLLASKYEATIIVCDKDLAQGIQEHDRSLMSEFFNLGYRKNDLVSLNIVCRFQNLLHVSNIVKCRRTINEFVTSEYLEVSIHHTFPQEEPTPADFRM